MNDRQTTALGLLSRRFLLLGLVMGAFAQLDLPAVGAASASQPTDAVHAPQRSACDARLSCQGALRT